MTKKHFLSVASVSLILLAINMVTNAQTTTSQTKGKGWIYNIEAGKTTFMNNSALSLFEDATATYSGMGYNIMIGKYRKDSETMRGLRLKTFQAQTSHRDISEQVGLIIPEWTSIKTKQILPNFNVFFEYNFDLPIKENNYTIENKDYSRTKIGFGISDAFGFSFTPSQYSSLSLKFGVFVYRDFKKTGNLDGPQALLPEKNQERNYEGYEIMLSYSLIL